MTGIDSNILLRFLTQDDVVQSPLATELIQRRLTEYRPGFISLVTIAEVVWTLSAKNRLPGPQIANLLEGLLGATNLVVQNEQQVAAGVVALYEGAPFADTLIAALGLTAGCTTTYTFDRKAARLPGFTLLSHTQTR